MSKSKVNPQDLTYVEAAVLAGVSDSYIGDLVRNGTLSKPLTVEAIREWSDNRSRGRSSSKAKWYHVRCTPEEFEALSEQFETRDPAAEEKAARERKAEEARKALESMGLEL